MCKRAALEHGFAANLTVSFSHAAMLKRKVPTSGYGSKLAPQVLVHASIYQGKHFGVSLF